MPHLAPVKTIMAFQQKAFDQCFSSMVVLQAQLENLFFSSLENQPGLSDEQVDLLRKTADLFSEYRRQYRNSILRHYDMLTKMIGSGEK